MFRIQGLKLLPPCVVSVFCEIRGIDTAVLRYQVSPGFPNILPIIIKRNHLHSYLRCDIINIRIVLHRNQISPLYFRSVPFDKLHFQRCKTVKCPPHTTVILLAYACYSDGFLGFILLTCYGDK